MCTRRMPHEWKTCPYAHPGELVKRRPLDRGYTPVPCPYLKRDGTCPKGDDCCFAHNLWETWMHPDRYRTQMCTDGASCKRKVCMHAAAMHLSWTSHGHGHAPAMQAHWGSFES